MNLEPEKILELDLESAFKLLNILKIEQPQNKQLQNAYNKTRNGIKIKFDIYNMIAKNMHEDTKNLEITIENKTYKLTDFYTEIEQREITTKKAILDSLQEEELTTIR